MQIGKECTQKAQHDIECRFVACLGERCICKYSKSRHSKAKHDIVRQIVLHVIFRFADLLHVFYEVCIKGMILTGFVDQSSSQV